MIPANTVKKGTVLSDHTTPPPWQQCVVLDVNHYDMLLKRPYTNPGKSFIVFEEVSVSLSELSTERFTVTRI